MNQKAEENLGDSDFQSSQLNKIVKPKIKLASSLQQIKGILIARLS
jgi:hypothetical protein